MEFLKYSRILIVVQCRQIHTTIDDTVVRKIVLGCRNIWQWQWFISYCIFMVTVFSIIFSMTINRIFVKVYLNLQYWTFYQIGIVKYYLPGLMRNNWLIGYAHLCSLIENTFRVLVYFVKRLKTFLNLFTTSFWLKFWHFSVILVLDLFQYF